MIRPVNIADYIDSIEHLVRENWAESGMDFTINIDRESYIHLQETDQLFALAAFDEAGQVIGYSTAAIGPHLFNPAVIVCQSDALFVTKAQRGGVLPGRLVLATERAAKERGAHYMLWQVGVSSPGLSSAFKRRMYAQIDRSFARWL